MDTQRDTYIPMKIIPVTKHNSGQGNNKASLKHETLLDSCDIRRNRERSSLKVVTFISVSVSV